MNKALLKISRFLILVGFSQLLFLSWINGLVVPQDAAIKELAEKTEDETEGEE